jgi:hypothetical protein
MTIDLSQPESPQLSEEWLHIRHTHLVSEIRIMCRHRRRRSVALVAATGAIAGVATLLGVGLHGPSSNSAFADWAPTTDAHSATQLATAYSACNLTFARISTGLGGGDPELGSSLPPVVLNDSRGPFNLIVYADPSHFDLCLWAPHLLSFTGGGALADLAPAPNAVSVGRYGFAISGSAPYTFIAGDVGSEVTGMTITLADGTKMEATVQGGLFAAWWPSKVNPSSAQLTTSSGILDQTLILPAAGT